jgi:hypothetical protein
MFPGMKLAALAPNETMAEGTTIKYGLLQKSNKQIMLPTASAMFPIMTTYWAVVSWPNIARCPLRQRDRYQGDGL